MSVEPPETITINLTSTGPSQEYIDLFNITVQETIVQIIDNDSKLGGSHSVEKPISTFLVLLTVATHLDTTFLHVLLRQFNCAHLAVSKKFNM